MYLHVFHVIQNVLEIFVTGHPRELLGHVSLVDFGDGTSLFPVGRSLGVDAIFVVVVVHEKAVTITILGERRWMASHGCVLVEKNVDVSAPGPAADKCKERKTVGVNEHERIGGVKVNAE